MEKKLHDSPSDTEKNCLLKSDKKDDYTHHFLSQYAHLKAFLGYCKTTHDEKNHSKFMFSHNMHI